MKKQKTGNDPFHRTTVVWNRQINDSPKNFGKWAELLTNSDIIFRTSNLCDDKVWKLEI